MEEAGKPEIDPNGDLVLHAGNGDLQLRKPATFQRLNGLRKNIETHYVFVGIELIPIQRINEAFERAIRSDVRYRFVIDMASLNSGNPVMPYDLAFSPAEVRPHGWR